MFALLAHKDKVTVDPLDFSQWRFDVLPTAILDNRTRSQHSITLKALEGICGAAVTYERLCALLGEAADQQRQQPDKEASDRGILGSISADSDARIIDSQ